MPLPSPELDDRKFQDIVDEAKRLIPRYCPEWTNHNVSDPGVALIELFAWMSEMVLFRVNQVPERLYVHFLNMIGIEPFPPSVSRTDVTFWLSTVLETPVVVPEGTQVMTTAGASSGNAEAVVFTTAQDLVISPPRLVGAMTTTVHGDRAVDVWDNVRYDPQGVACFASPELTPGDAFLLAFGESLAGTALRITVEAEAEGIGVDPRTPPLIWEVWNSEAWLVCQVTEDTTGGLNRAGEIVLLVPVEHELLTVGNMAAYWLRVRLLRPEPGQPTYQVSPRVRTITAETLGGTVTAEHSENIPGEFIGRSDGRAAQSFPVSHAPVLPRRHDETVTVIDPGGDIVGWTEVADFSESQPDDRHFVWETGTGTVRFGPRVRYADGSVRQHGAIPRDGSEVRVTGYRHGGGARGNVGARTLTVMRSTVPFVRASVNLAPAVGGVDAESIAEAKVRAPLTLRTGQRAVTAGDYERLTRESSVEVARARCLSAQRGNGAVRMLVVPRVRGDATTHHIDDYAIGAPLLRRIGEHLDEHRLVGTSIEIGTPYYQGVSVVALVHAGPGRPAALVRQRVLDALTRYINPLTGGSDGEGWPFDVDINSAVVSQLIETVEGVERIDEVLLFEFDLRTGQRLGAAKDVIRLDQHSLFLSAPHQVVVR